jgi:hypothetical protein
VDATPILLMAYNRPEKLRGVIDALRSQKPRKMIVAVDGPKLGNLIDAEKVGQVRELVSTIDWTDDVTPLFQPVNIGLRASVVSAVTAATEEFGRVIVIEDDAIPGPNMIPFVSRALEVHQHSRHIEHVSGYDLVPNRHLSSPGRGSRLSRYAESYAWGTWQRAWAGYDDALEWGMNATIADLSNIVGSKVGALRWKQNFADAASGRISTWAYRWMASMWSRGTFVLAPNGNLTTYRGHEDGTHTTLKPRWKEIELFDGDAFQLLEGVPMHDRDADAWAARIVYSETLYGLARGVPISVVLEARKRIRARRRARLVSTD